MGKRLLQAAILTFLIQLLASMSSQTTIQINSLPRLRSAQKPVAFLLQRLFQLPNTKFTKGVNEDRFDSNYAKTLVLPP